MVKKKKTLKKKTFETAGSLSSSLLRFAEPGQLLPAGLPRMAFRATTWLSTGHLAQVGEEGAAKKRRSEQFFWETISE